MHIVRVLSEIMLTHTPLNVALMLVRVKMHMTLLVFICLPSIVSNMITISDDVHVVQ